MFQNSFVNPNIYHTGATLDGYAFVTGTTILAADARLLGLIAYNSGSNGFIQIHDGYTQPASNAVPIATLSIPASSTMTLDCTAFHCINFAKGITVAFSSTAGTYTDGGQHVFLTVFWI